MTNFTFTLWASVRHVHQHESVTLTAGIVHILCIHCCIHCTLCSCMVLYIVSFMPLIPWGVICLCVYITVLSVQLASHLSLTIITCNLTTWPTLGENSVKYTTRTRDHAEARGVGVPGGSVCVQWTWRLWSRTRTWTWTCKWFFSYFVALPLCAFALLYIMAWMRMMVC